MAYIQLAGHIVANYIPNTKFNMMDKESARNEVVNYK